MPPIYVETRCVNMSLTEHLNTVWKDTTDTEHTLVTVLQVTWPGDLQPREAYRCIWAAIPRRVRLAATSTTPNSEFPKPAA